MGCCQIKAVHGDRIHHFLEAFECPEGSTVGAVEQEGRLALMLTGLQVDHSACAECSNCSTVIWRSAVIN
jgi:hypothetical protein